MATGSHRLYPNSRRIRNFMSGVSQGISGGISQWHTRGKKVKDEPIEAKVADTYMTWTSGNKLPPKLVFFRKYWKKASLYFARIHWRWRIIYWGSMKMSGNEASNRNVFKRWWNVDRDGGRYHVVRSIMQSIRQSVDGLDESSLPQSTRAHHTCNNIFSVMGN